MSCEACAQARENRWCGMYRAACDGCTARALSQSPMYHEAAQAEAMTPAYRDALQRAFGDRWREGHAMVKEWAQ